jgi:RHS repeat-associated protein
VHKEVTKKDNSTFGTDSSSQRTVYFRDAQGNVLQTHSHKSTTILWTYEESQSKEYVIYGSSRLGTYSPEHNVYNGSFNRIGDYALTLGYKHYELSNHLGNVLTTIADNFAPHPPTGGVLARVLSTQDYYPFGMAMTERGFVESTEKKYRYGFNGKEYDEDLGEGMMNFEARMMDNRTCRFTSPDPLAVKYPNISPFVFVANMPIIAIDPDGKDIEITGKAGDLEGLPIKYKIGMSHIQTDDGLKYDQKTSEIIQMLNYLSEVVIEVDLTSIGRKSKEKVNIVEYLSTNEFIKLGITTNNTHRNAFGGSGDDFVVDNILKYDTRSGVEFRVGDKTEKQSPIVGFYHELAHAYLYNLIRDKYNDGSGGDKTFPHTFTNSLGHLVTQSIKKADFMYLKKFQASTDNDYEKKGEEIVMTIFEAAMSKIKGETVRPSHKEEDNKVYHTKSPFSTEEDK